MAYFVTGATGFIGSHFLKKLFNRKGKIYVLVRSGSKKKLKDLMERIDAPKDRVIAITGDIGKRVWVSVKKIKTSLKARFSTFSIWLPFMI